MLDKSKLKVIEQIKVERFENKQAQLENRPYSVTESPAVESTKERSEVEQLVSTVLNTSAEDAKGIVEEMINAPT